MIVDTSALIAVALREAGYEELLTTLLTQAGSLPAPALVEYRRVTSRKGEDIRQAGEALLGELLSANLAIEPFGAEDARLAGEANRDYGAGNSRGGTLNLLDLMVYAVAKRMDMPILCTGRDFSATDATIHPASRP